MTPLELVGIFNDLFHGGERIVVLPCRGKCGLQPPPGKVMTCRINIMNQPPKIYVHCTPTFVSWMNQNES